MIERVVTALSGARFLCADEEELQRAVAKVLDDAAIPYQREVRLSARDRVDFMVDGIAIELKVKTGAKELLRQVLRYAEHAQVESVLVGSTSHRALDLPFTANGKVLRVVHLRSW